MANNPDNSLSPGKQITRSFFFIATAIIVSVLSQNIYLWTDGSTVGQFFSFLLIGGYVGLSWKKLRVLADKLAFAVSSSSAIGIGTALGTFLPQHSQPAHFWGAETFFGQLLLFFQANDIFHSWWYVSLYVLLVVSLVLVTFRYPFSKDHLGFHLIHSSLVVIVVCVWVDFFFGFRGIMHLEVGQSTNRINIYNRNTTEVIGQLETDYAVRLDSFSSKKHDPDYRIQVWTKNIASNSAGDTALKSAPKPIASFKIDTAANYFLFGKQFNFSISNFYPDAYIVHSARNTTDNSGFAPVLWGTIRATGVRKQFRLNEARRTITAPFGKETLSFVWTRAQADSIRSSLSTQKKQHYITIGETPYLVAEGSVVYNTDSLQITVSSIEETADSAGKIIQKAILDCTVQDSAFTIWLGADQTEVPPHLQEKLDETIRYTVKETITNVIIGEDSTLLTSKGALLTEETLQFGKPYVLKGWSPMEFTFDAVFRNEANVVSELASLSNELNNPIADITVFEETDTVASGMLRPFDGSFATILDIPGTDHFLTLESLKSKETEYWKSTVTFLRPNNEIADHAEIQVNHPKTFDGYRFYQTDFDPLRPQYSGIGVTYEPALYVLYTAFYALVTGIVLVFYWHRKKE